MTHTLDPDELAALVAALDDRVEVWREVVDPDGTVGAPVYRGSIYAPDSHREPDTGEQP